jgi:hypothetical protein
MARQTRDHLEPLFQPLHRNTLAAGEAPAPAYFKLTQTVWT